jgi:hypothetical protein
VATSVRASTGQGKNQSIVVFETSPGKLRQRRRNVSPAGVIARIMCRFSLAFFTKYYQRNSLDSGSFNFFISESKGEIKPSFSSSANSAGTIPMVRILLMSSKNPSSATWESVNMKVLG